MLQSTLQFWEEQSALANFLAVVTVLFSLVAAGYTAYVKRKPTKFHSMQEWVNFKFPTLSTAKDLRIAVVDDRPEDYPLAELRRLGYSITDIQTLSLSEIPNLRAYDIILLDINGVLKEDPKRGGFEILKRLKSPKGPFIVAVSSRGFDITMSDFFMLADQRLKKPIPEVKVEGVLEDAFALRFSKIHAARRIDSALTSSGNLPKQKTKCLTSILSYAATGNKYDEMLMQIYSFFPGDASQRILNDIEIIKA